MNHQNTLNGGLVWNPTTLAQATAGLNGTRSLTENWTLSPINDPTRLELMKCVYRYVTQPECQLECDPCSERLRLFFGPEYFSALPSCFYSISDKRPRFNSCCIKHGEYCGTFVFVNQANHECLSKLTMAILDIATISNESLAKRMSTAPKSIDISTTFIANVNGRPQLIQGTYSIPFDKFERLQDNAIPRLDSSMTELLSPDSSLGPAFGGSGLQFNELNASPATSGNSLDVPSRVPENVGSSFESLLQMNLAPIVPQ